MSGAPTRIASRRRCPCGAQPPHGAESGFTLLEALVAITLLAIIVMHFLGTRTQAMMDAADARNWRIAREIAESRLSEVKAGANEIPPENRMLVDLGEDFPGFRYQILIGEAAIAEAESQLADNLGTDDESRDFATRLDWQRERDTLRRAQATGVSYSDYIDQQRSEELEERLPSEDEFEEVGIIVYFPNMRREEETDPIDSTFMLRAKISTMAIEGLTPELAEAAVAARGGGTTGDSMSGGSDR